MKNPGKAPHNIHLTRRQVAGFIAATTVASRSAIAQAPAEIEKKALDSVGRNGKTLGAVDIPLSTEPAFHFKA